MAMAGLLITFIFLLVIAGAALIGLMYLLASIATKVERRKYG